MKLDSPSLRIYLTTLRNFFRIGRNASLLFQQELPLRAELFSASQMERHGKVLANAHKVDDKLAIKRGDEHLLLRLADNEKVIFHASVRLTDAIKAGRQVTPAAEWLLDNFYLVEEQIRTARHHFPKNYSKELPRLLRGSSAGRPRVYDIALETISHGDGRVDPESLSRFVASYQQVTHLELGELWAIPIMLRLALIENLRRVAARLATTRISRNLAHAWADVMSDVVEKDPSKLILLVADMARSDPPMDSSFVAEFVRRLQGKGPTLTLPLTWLSQHLAESGETIDHLVHFETQQQAADQVSISNSIGSLRFLSAMDWREFVETMSVVDQVLRQDPADVYLRMDFPTRDHYRHVVETVARHSPQTENTIAEHALRLAAAAGVEYGPNDRRAHIGYYLIGNGLPLLEQVAAFRQTPKHILHKGLRHSHLSVYLGSLLLLTLLATGGIIAQARVVGAEGWLLAFIGLVALVGTSQLAVGLVNWIATLVVMPRPLPRMNFSKGIPQSARTMVVVPSMLLTSHNIDALTEALEVCFLANRDDNLRFCLLTDFGDAGTETLPSDDILLARMKGSVEALNEKYPCVGRTDFFLLHRPRRWNPQENVWMGYERKRGKLGDLNALLLDSPDAHGAFSLTVGDLDTLGHIRYVITLDTDTELPRDAARSFVATMEHPLNRALYDAQHGRVCEGYGILQPRVVVSLPGREASHYELLCGGEAGIDPYTRTVSDVYQDLFGEGSFIGKGIYDVNVFEQVLHDRMPENRILSHDLLEGCYVRAGLLSDAQLHEPYPSRYSTDMRRRHRWIRGDWQIASWLLPWVPDAPAADSGKISMRRNPLSALSRWKLFDNLRRSIVPIALSALLITGWLTTQTAWFWSITVLVILLLPVVCALGMNLLRKPSDTLLRQHLTMVFKAGQQSLTHVLLTLIFLPYEAWCNLDAILRTQWRVLVTHKKLLEWTVSGESEKLDKHSLYASFCRMWIAPYLAIVVAALLVVYQSDALHAAVPILLLWIISPIVAWWISLPLQPHVVQLTPIQTRYLHMLSRKTWRFFETYVGPADNWLPPDNVQEHPVEVIAHRTSPTNIGLSLLASLAARDFGYISTGQLLQRTQHTLNTMASLARFQGHFYNWYDTQYLQPLRPMYISTVDSGNLAGHLHIPIRYGGKYACNYDANNICNCLNSGAILREPLHCVTPF